MIVYLVPAGRDRFELYSEAPEDPAEASSEHDGRLVRWYRAVRAQWQDLVETARHGKARGRLARWRDTIVCRLAEAVAEQRTLWALRGRTTACLRFPSTLNAARAQAILRTDLARARHHHLRWLIADLVLFFASAVFFFVPGPNIVAYYFLFRWVGHLQSWRGARQGMDRVAWAFEPDGGLAELGSLVDLPRDTRAPRVATIAARLNLSRLAAFFDRVAVRGAS